jgi:hypothetical protein
MQPLDEKDVIPTSPCNPYFEADDGRAVPLFGLTRWSCWIQFGLLYLVQGCHIVVFLRDVSCERSVDSEVR